MTPFSMFLGPGRCVLLYGSSIRLVIHERRPAPLSDRLINRRFWNRVFVNVTF